MRAWSQWELYFGPLVRVTGNSDVSARNAFRKSRSSPTIETASRLSVVGFMFPKHWAVARVSTCRGSKSPTRTDELEAMFQKHDLLNAVMYVELMPDFLKQ